MDLGKSLVDRFDFSQDAPGNIHRIGAGLFADGHAQAAPAVDAHDACQLFIGVFDFGNLPQPDGGPVFSGQ